MGMYRGRDTDNALGKVIVALKMKQMEFEIRAEESRKKRHIKIATKYLTKLIEEQGEGS